MITVLTPTYNRAYILDKAYKSLCQQTNKNFEWLIIDDGSTDNTQEIVKRFIDEKKIKIHYFYQKNGGKHRALNRGAIKAKGDYVLILDSDDYLSKNAVSRIYYYINKYKDRDDIAIFDFLRGFPDGNVIGKKYEGNEIISDVIDFKFNQNHLGDMCEVIKKNILKSYKFPEYENEKFISECVVWNKIAFKYRTLFINEIIYYTDYLADGLSKNILRHRYYSPKGCIENCLIFMNKRFKPYIRFKNIIMYVGFCKIDNRNFKTIMHDTECKFMTFLLYPLGILFKLYITYEVKKK